MMFISFFSFGTVVFPQTHKTPSFFTAQACSNIAKMKSATLYLLAALTAVNAMPVVGEDSSLEQRQTKTTSNDLKNGPCMPVTFIMARGSTETGNMVSSGRALSALPPIYSSHTQEN